MNEDQFENLLNELVSLPSETEWVEFKLNKGSISNEEIGEYISALSNGACLKNQPFGYLVWGIHDITHEIKGTDFDFSRARQGNQDLELWLRSLLQPKIHFTIHQAKKENRGIVLLQIPAADGQPVYFKSRAFVRITSHKTELSKFPDLVRQIYNSQSDWSAKIVEKATIKDLDRSALNMARMKFIERNSKLSKEIESWPDEVFLDKAKITINGEITRTALLLLGKEESSHYILPANAQITWKLDTEEQAYEHYGPPYLINATRIADRIRNYKYKFFPDDVLLSVTVDKYDREVILEALYNCIAHQDYSENSRLLLTEQKDKLVFSNAGSFYEGKPEDYVLGKTTPKRYRNHWLAQAMVNLNMIDTLGYGIHKMFREQRRRFFPLPQYNLQNPREVELVIYGHSIDEAYSKLLLKHTDLPLSTIIILDRFQKKLKIPEKELEFLKKKGLISGRKPNYFLSETISVKSGEVGRYIKNRGFDKIWYKNLILEYIQKQKSGVSKTEIKDFLWEKLPDVLTDNKKINKVTNLLQELRRDGKIINQGTFGKPSWISVD